MSAATRTVQFTLNGELRVAQVEPRLNLADCLRHSLGCTGTHVGCEHGVCGACTVHLDGEAVRSCSTAVSEAAGKSVTTIEGLGTPDALHAVQKAWIEHSVASASPARSCRPSRCSTTTLSPPSRRPASPCPAISAAAAPMTIISRR